jgi:hypothetical protein
MLDAALLVWVTDVRPTVIVQDPPGPCEPMRDECVLLADLELDVMRDPGTSRWSLAGDPRIIETRRPYLLHTRLLQEWLACVGWHLTAGMAGPAAPFSPPTSPPSTRLQPGLSIAPNGSTYGPVAAGRFEVRMGAGNLMLVGPIGPTFNNLQVSHIRRTQGDFRLGFDGYVEPQSSTDPVYVVSGRVEEHSSPGFVHLVSLDSNGLRVGVRGAGGGRLRSAFNFSVEVVRISAS